MGLFKVIFYIISIYLIIKWVVGPILRILLQNYLKSVVEKQAGQFRQQQAPKKPEGSIHVDYVPKNTKKPHSGDSDGEYIDYEEVK
ncbi:MAG: DUF4834 family protein [Cytophagaceae bacterium]